jgi:16S rRNA (uracil1498-N3)-methyltransferase
MSERRPIRIFVEQALEAGSTFALAESQAHYATHVMRLKVGDALLVFNGLHGEWSAQIAAVSKKGCQIRLMTQSRPQAAEPDVWLAFAPIKRARIDLIIEKATELGASVLWPVFTQHTNAERVNLARLRATAIEAAEQCERLTLPDVREPMALAHVMKAWPAQRRLMLLDETGAGRPIAAALADVASQPCGFLVGPEGGFTQSELDGLALLPFVTRVGLGPRILRAETAALAALVTWQSLVGDWR